MTPTRRILVQRYLRRSPKTPERVVRGALRQLRSLDADHNLKYACRIQVTEQDSQVIPEKRLGFRRNVCSVINVGDNHELSDIEDEVEAATTIYHEALHARDISKDGEKAITKENEIKAHEETIAFLKDWAKIEKRDHVKKRIAEELEEEREAIQTLRLEED